MDKKYISGGTFRLCPFSKENTIITFSEQGKTFDRSQCPYHSECTDESCPLCNYLKNC